MSDKKEVVVATDEATEVVEQVGSVLELRKPILIDGEMTDKIPYNLENLTGYDIQHANKELSKRGMQVMVSELDQNYHAMLFAIASGLSFEDVSRLNLKDYNKMCSVVRDFFLEE